MLSLRSIRRAADVKAAIMRVHARSFGTDVPQGDVKTKVPQDGFPAQDRILELTERFHRTAFSCSH